MRKLSLLLAMVIGFTPMTIAPLLAQDASMGDDLVGIRLIDAPEDRRDDPRARSAIIDHLPVLSEIERRVEVTNTTDETVEILMYAAAAEATEDGWEVAGGRQQNELTQMVTVDPPVLTIPPDGGGIATMRLSIPADAPQREHYAVIWAELPPGESDTITTINRVGIRMYISIGNGAEPASDFVVDTLAAGRNPAGAPVVRARVENIGGRALDLGGTLTLSNGPGGLTAGPFTTPSVSTLGIGENAPIAVELDPALPAGPWLATMTMTSGLLERTVEAEITFPEASEVDPDELEDDGSIFAEPVEARPVRPGGPVGPAIAGLLLLLTAGLLFLAWRRRKDEDDEVPEPEAEPEPEPEPEPTPGVSARKKASDD